MQNKNLQSNSYEVINCPVCECTNHQPVLSSPKELVIVQCTNCNFIFAKNIPSDEELAEYYGNNYYSINDEGIYTPHLTWHRRLKYQLFIWWITRFFPAKEKVKLLEIGCSQGDLLRELQNNPKFDACGLDFGGAPINYARSLGLNVQQGSLESMDFPSESFDLVVAIHTIEHLQNPIRTLTEIHRILKKGGLFFVVVPCISHIKAKRSGKNWKYWGKGHLWYFSTKTMALFVNKFGFDVLHLSCFYHRAHLRLLARKS